MSSANATWSFTHDANGMRTKRTNGTTTYEYVYNGSQLVQLTVGETVLSFTYDANGIPQTITENGEVYHYITNQQGDVVAIRNETGALLVSYSYDAWGKVLAIGGPFEASLGFVNPSRYRGYVYDHETGLYYLQSRYYDPEMGRFLNADVYTSTGQGLLGSNMFAYCGNNPVMRFDVCGCAWKDIWKKVREIYNQVVSVQLQQQALDTQIRLEQHKIIGDGIKGTYNTYLEETQRRQTIENRILMEQQIHFRKIIGFVNDFQNSDFYGLASPIYEMVSSANLIREGAGDILVPVPTVIDDLIGMGKITYGIISFVYNFAMLIVEVDNSAK